MSTRKILALAGLLLILGAGLSLAQAQTKAQEANKVQSKIATQAQTRTKFMDQNGDGINDLYRDHDNDGIPNCQDPDWTRPQDGTGYKKRNRNLNLLFPLHTQSSHYVRDLCRPPWKQHISC